MTINEALRDWLTSMKKTTDKMNADCENLVISIYSLEVDHKSVDNLCQISGLLTEIQHELDIVNGVLDKESDVSK